MVGLYSIEEEADVLIELLEWDLDIEVIFKDEYIFVAAILHDLGDSDV